MPGGGQVVPGISKLEPTGLRDAAFTVVPFFVHFGPTGDIAAVGGLQVIGIPVLFLGITA